MSLDTTCEALDCIAPATRRLEVIDICEAHYAEMRRGIARAAASLDRMPLHVCHGRPEYGERGYDVRLDVGETCPICGGWGGR